LAGDLFCTGEIVGDEQVATGIDRHMVDLSPEISDSPQLRTVDEHDELGGGMCCSDLPACRGKQESRDQRQAAAYGAIQEASALLCHRKY